jgi:hypothetical protein
MMAITKRDIAAVVTIVVLNSLLYANFVTTTAYAQDISFISNNLGLNLAQERLEEAERQLEETKRRMSEANLAAAEERRAEREQERLAWPQQHQQDIQEMEAAIQQAGINLTTTRQTGNQTIAKQLGNPQVQAAQAQDPQFKTFVDIWQSCMNSLISNTPILPGQCTTPFFDANMRWCGIDQYDPNKCTLSSQMSMDFSQLSAGLAYSQEQVTNLQAQLTELRSVTFFDVHGCMWYEEDAGLCDDGIQ